MLKTFMPSGTCTQGPQPRLQRTITKNHGVITMKNVCLAVLIFCTLVGCATTGCATPAPPASPAPTQPLYDAYYYYSQNANRDNIIDVASKYFSPTLLGENYKTNPDASSQFLFKNYMQEATNHYEKVNDQSGCLTINGFDADQYPVMFSLGYALIDNTWLIDQIHVVFVKSEKDFVAQAKCRSEFTD